MTNRNQTAVWRNIVCWTRTNGKPIIEEARLKEGDFLEIEAGDGRIELRRATKIPTLAQLVSQITPDNRCPEISTGPEVGKERVEW
jgi:antitoxin component of MazEF toxin-antitoxin module